MSAQLEVFASLVYCCCPGPVSLLAGDECSDVLCHRLSSAWSPGQTSLSFPHSLSVSTPSPIAAPSTILRYPAVIYYDKRLGLVPTPPCHVIAVLFEHLILIRIIKLAFLARQRGRGGQGQAPFNLAMNCLDRRSRLFWSSATVGCTARCSLRPLPVPGGRRWNACHASDTPPPFVWDWERTGTKQQSSSFAVDRRRYEGDDARLGLPSCALLHQPDRICDAWTLDHAHMPRDPHHPCNDLTATGPRPALHWRRVTNYILLRLRGTAHGVSVTHQRALATCSRQSPTALRKPQTVYVLSRARQVFTSSSSLQNCCSFLILTGVGHF